MFSSAARSALSRLTSSTPLPLRTFVPLTIYRPYLRPTYSTSTPTMAVDESTQTNGVAQPGAGQLNAQDVEQSSWTVQSGTS